MALPSITPPVVILSGRCKAGEDCEAFFFFWQLLVEIYKVSGKCFIILCTSLAAAERH